MSTPENVSKPIDDQAATGQDNNLEPAKSEEKPDEALHAAPPNEPRLPQAHLCDPGPPANIHNPGVVISRPSTETDVPGRFFLKKGAVDLSSGSERSISKTSPFPDPDREPIYEGWQFETLSDTEEGSSVSLDSRQASTHNDLQAYQNYRDQRSADERHHFTSGQSISPAIMASAVAHNLLEKFEETGESAVILCLDARSVSDPLHVSAWIDSFSANLSDTVDPKSIRENAVKTVTNPANLEIIDDLNHPAGEDFQDSVRKQSSRLPKGFFAPRLIVLAPPKVSKLLSKYELNYGDVRFLAAELDSRLPGQVYQDTVVALFSGLAARSKDVPPINTRPTDGTESLNEFQKAAWKIRQQSLLEDD